MEHLPALAAALLGVLIGWLVTWYVLATRHRAEKQAALANMQLQIQGTLATARERAELLDRVNRSQQDELLQQREAIARTKQELDTSREEVSRLQERASHIPRLGQEVQELRQQLQDIGDERSNAVAQLASLNATAVRVPGLENALREAQEQASRVSTQMGELREQIGTAQASLDSNVNALRDKNAEAERLAQALKAAEGEASALLAELERVRQELKGEQESAAERLRILNDAQGALKDQFKALAADFLDGSSKRLQENNQTSLSALLDPLKTRLSDFQKKVEDVYVDESKERSALKQQVENLVSLNQTLSQDARNLTSALRGSAKNQGNWGELILERVLEASGLRRGEEYLVQDSQTNDDGQRQQPDVVINLPEERRLVIDSKVSLVAYERFATTETEPLRETALREHLASVRGHVRSLSEKRYQNLYGQSLDFVLMFVPIEPAFMAAVTHDQQLFMDAWSKNVLLVSPSTLLFVVRTVAHLWRQEAQSRNAQDIAKRGAELYDKFASFVVDLDAVGNRLDAAQQSFSEARKKLSTGRGNVVRQAEMLRDLGVKPSKQLPHALVEASLAEDGVLLQ